MRKLFGDTKLPPEITVRAEKLIFIFAVKNFPAFCVSES
jgi:hypothetical protein